MNYAEIKKRDISNGIGVRVSLFVSGCTHYCKGCFNSVAWDFNYGKEFTFNTMRIIENELDNSFISGLSLLGGEPLLQCDNEYITSLCKYTHFLKKDVWCWTGFTWEEIVQNDKMFNFVKNNIDVLVDGKFEEELYSPMLRFKGSSNQRTIDVKKSTKENIVIMEGFY